MIKGDYIELESKDINTDERSIIKANKELSIKSDNFSEITIESPNIILNDKKIYPKTKKIVLKKSDEISSRRIELTELLKLLKEECTILNEQITTKYKEELYNKKPLKKILN